MLQRRRETIEDFQIKEVFQSDTHFKKTAVGYSRKAKTLDFVDYGFEQGENGEKN